MKKSTKGAVAGSAAALLLLAGWGTHATWDAGATAQGTNLATGHLRLVPNCAGWTLNGISYNAASDLLVPGSILNKHCTFTVDVKGVMTVNLSVNSPSYSNDSGGLGSILNAGATFKDAQDNAIPSGATLTDGEVITADITVKLLSTVTDGQDLSTTLNDLTVTATQA